MSTNLEHGNVDSRKRERRYLEPDERRALLSAAKHGRWAARDYALVLLAYRHGLRCSEIIGLRWEDVKLPAARLFVQLTSLTIVDVTAEQSSHRTRDDRTVVTFKRSPALDIFKQALGTPR